MSACAVTPETYAVWGSLETDDEGLHEREAAEIVRGEEELALLLPGTKSLRISPPRKQTAVVFLRFGS
jgi:hypothetical protein